jgi:hypothetical protein
VDTSALSGFRSYDRQSNGWEKANHEMICSSCERYDENMPGHSIEEAVVAKLRELPADKQQEVLDFASFLGTKQMRPRKSLYGLWKDLGISISEEDIAEARKEMWGNFPREQFFK